LPDESTTARKHADESTQNRKVSTARHPASMIAKDGGHRSPHALRRFRFAAG
jgi:hypothetical protein